MKIFKSGGKLHWIKNLYGRYRYGVGCCDEFNLDNYLAPKILKGLKRFRRNVGSHPSNLTHEQWEKILDDMIFAFQFLVDGEEYEDYKKDGKKKYIRQQKGFRLFGQYYRSLWK